MNGILTSRVRRQEKFTRDREERTSALYQLTRELSAAAGIHELIESAVKNIKKHFKTDSKFILQDGMNHLSEYCTGTSSKLLSETEMSVANGYSVILVKQENILIPCPQAD